MKKVLSVFTNEFYLKLTFVLLTLVYCVPILMPLMDELVNVLLLWSAALVVYDLLHERMVLKTRSVVIAALFLGSFGVTVLMNGFAVNDLKIAVYMVLQLFLFTAVRPSKSPEAVKVELCTLLRVFVILSTFLNLVSLVLYFCGYTQVFVNSVISMDLYVGKHPNTSMYGILGNSNWMSFLALTNIGFAAALHAMKKAGGKETVFLLVLNYIMLALTNSRGGIVGLMGFIFFWGVTHFFARVRQNKWKAIERLLLVPVFLLVVYGGSVGIKSSFSGIYQSLSHEGQTVQRETQEVLESTNIRFELWEAGVKVFADHPLFGVGLHGLNDAILEKTPEKSSIDRNLAGNTHNIYIQVLATCGGVGLLLFLLYAGRNLWFSFRCLIKPAFPPVEREGLVAILALVLSYLVVNLVEADIFLSRNFMSCLFWILLGYLTHAVGQYKGEALPAGEAPAASPAVPEDSGR